MEPSGAKAGFTFQVHPHMLRHACGFKLANDGADTRSLQHYLGHKNRVWSVVATHPSGRPALKYGTSFFGDVARDHPQHRLHFG